MESLAISHPEPAEYAPYFGRYISKVSGELFQAFETELQTTLLLLDGISEEKSRFRYAPGKWSIREVIGHIIDAERIFAYRALRFARHDQTELPGFDENLYVDHSNHDSVQLAELADELKLVRKSNVAFFRKLAPEDWSRKGIASNNEMSVRALAWTIIGHEVHHRQLIESRYLAG